MNKLNPKFMRNHFKLQLSKRHVWEKYKMNLIITEFNLFFMGRRVSKFLVQNLGTVAQKKFFETVWNSFINCEFYKKM